MRYQRESIERALAGIRSRDRDLDRELESHFARGQTKAGAESLAAALEGVEGVADDPAALAQPAYEYRVARPVLTVVRHELRVVESDAESEVWKQRLEQAGEHLLRAIDAVGRIEMKGNPDGTVAGTGFMVREDVIATNQHVAAQFAEEGDDGFVFKVNVGDETMEAAIDFLEEAGVRDSLEFPIVEVLLMQMDLLPDVAFLRVGPPIGGRRIPAAVLPAPLEFHTGDVEEGRYVAAIGYPEKDVRDDTAELMHRIFGDVFDKKRVSPGQICRIDPHSVVHDCSVLRGSSGSPLIDLETGKVVGIHSVGEFLKDNLAVPPSEAEATLQRKVDPAETSSPMAA